MPDLDGIPVWKDGSCQRCHMDEKHNCPEELCNKAAMPDFDGTPVWKDGSCQRCHRDELHGCPQEMCDAGMLGMTADQGMAVWKDHSCQRCSKHDTSGCPEEMCNKAAIPDFDGEPVWKDGSCQRCNKDHSQNCNEDTCKPALLQGASVFWRDGSCQKCVPYMPENCPEHMCNDSDMGMPGFQFDHDQNKCVREARGMSDSCGLMVTIEQDGSKHDLSHEEGGHKGTTHNSLGVWEDEMVLWSSPNMHSLRYRLKFPIADVHIETITAVYDAGATMKVETDDGRSWEQYCYDSNGFSVNVCTVHVGAAIGSEFTVTISSHHGSWNWWGKMEVHATCAGKCDDCECKTALALSNCGPSFESCKAGVSSNTDRDGRHAALCTSAECTAATDCFRGALESAAGCAHADTPSATKLRALESMCRITDLTDPYGSNSAPQMDTHHDACTAKALNEAATNGVACVGAGAGA